MRNKGVDIVSGDEDEDEDSKSSEEIKETKKMTKPKIKAGDMNPAKQRIWKLDNLRLEDYKKMKEISVNLSKMRKKDQRKIK